MLHLLLLLVCVCSASAAVDNPYEILGVTKDATHRQIKAAYRKLSLKWHPDKNKSAKGPEMINQINEAYEMIADEDLRVIYDEFGGDEKYFNKYEYERKMRMQGKQVSTKGFYEKSEDVQTLTIRNFYQAIRKGPMMVEFYAPWCGHCQDMVSPFKKTGILLDGIAKLGAVNCEVEQNLCQQQRINAYPDLKLFLPVDGKVEQTEEYYGEHTPEAMYTFVNAMINSEVKALSKADLEAARNSDDLWIVDFSAGAWCGPCTTLKTSLKTMATELTQFAKIGIFDCDADAQTCQDFGLPYFPQLRVFKKGKTSEFGDALDGNSGNSRQSPAVQSLNMFALVAKLLIEPNAEEHEQVMGESENDPRDEL